jgi:hypothetical protein
MDHVSRPEFARIFDRVSAMVDLQGATTAVEIENRMRVASYLFRKKAQSLRMIKELRKQLQRELGRRASGLDRQILFLKAGLYSSAT